MLYEVDSASLLTHLLCYSAAGRLPCDAAAALRRMLHSYAIPAAGSAESPAEGALSSSHAQLCFNMGLYPACKSFGLKSMLFMLLPVCRWCCVLTASSGIRALTCSVTSAPPPQAEASFSSSGISIKVIIKHSWVYS